MIPAAQLVVARTGRLAWYRREAGELRVLTPLDSVGSGGVTPAIVGGWLTARPDAEPFVLDPAALAAFGTLTAVLWHPLTRSSFIGAATALYERADTGEVVTHNVGVAAMAWSSDLRRLYFASPEGSLFVLEVAAAAAGPVLLTAGLGGTGRVHSVTMGPGGLVAVTSDAIVGVNLRHGTVMPLFSPPAGAFALDAPAIAIDHLRNMYFADDRGVVGTRGDGTEPRWVARAVHDSISE
jgi:hypothetical protein